MIHITINRTESGLVHSFTMSGHADFAKRGRDIVCAGASAVSFGTVNAIEALTGVKAQVKQGNGGFLQCTFPENISNETQEKVQLLLEAMIVSLEGIEKEYGKHIKLTFKQ
ncbi:MULTISPECIES: ribosomal-processing cysteine protease Prp [Neobacillus]|uniref:Ribosomal processing cysteine protease Prp n=1 Tax=Neobacillus citreus TaxID=2833578 RepID=A0A942YBZ9_9BACI|nr:ribosomal-processing cysteine protease Prp [Neobacillus citreus]MCH6266709.1 ribosomal-processing cysteine protease Prp [Neobacillus citreus]